MKKNSFFRFIKKGALLSSICALCFAGFIGCKTVVQDESVPVKTVDILDDEGAMYIHIPAEENRELLELFVMNFYKQLNQNDAKLIVSKIDDVFASFGSKKDKKRIHLAVEGKFPGTINSILKKSGFEENTYSAASLSEEVVFPSDYRYFKNRNLQIALPSESQMVFSQNVKPLLDMYNCEKQFLNGGFSLNGDSEEDNDCDNSSIYRNDWKSSDLYDWISSDVPSIHFYIVRPQAFLTNLIGTDISNKVFKLVYAKGNFSKLPNSKYELTLELDFQDKKYVKPAVSLLILALGLTDSELRLTSPTHVILSGVHLNVSQLINMLGI